MTGVCMCVFVFFKQKTAYEMRISDWSSDVCSSDLGDLALVRPTPALEAFMADRHYVERHVPLLKPVAAVAGATVCRAGLHVTIDGHAAVSALSRDRFGRPLPAWSGCRRLVAHELFLKIGRAHV